jgi:hypothetical protein
MKVTEHYGNTPPDLQGDEIDALLELVKDQITNDEEKSVRLFYAKIYGKLLGMKTALNI